MKTHIRVILVILIFNLLATNCSLQKDTAAQESTKIGWEDLQVSPKPNDNLCTKISIDELDWEQSKQDFAYGLYNAIEPAAAPNQGDLAEGTQWVNANEPLIFNWRFWYPEGNEESASLRLFVLLDERQLEDALPEPGIYNDINLQPGDDKSIKVNISPLSDGIHEIILVGIPYPQNEPNIYGNVVVVSRRITLIVGFPPSPPFRNINFTTLPAEGSNKHNDPAMTLELTLEKDGIDVWNWPHPWLDLQENTPLTFYALGGHQDVINLDAPDVEPLKSSFSAFLLFVDYQQVEIAPNQTVLYAKMDSDTAYARLPITLPPLPAGKHHLLVLRIDTPGVPMCILWDNPDERILPNSVHGKLVGVNVLPEK
jgi:hypothetical protein